MKNFIFAIIYCVAMVFLLIICVIIAEEVKTTYGVVLASLVGSFGIIAYQFISKHLEDK